MSFSISCAEFIGKMVDGIINMPVDQEGKHLLPALEKGIPVLLIDRIIPKLKNVDSVVIDNARAADEGRNLFDVSLLLEQGHRRIGIIVGPQDIYTSRQRKEGYKAALNRYGIKEDERLIVYSDYTLQGGYESMRKLLQRR
jgi:LacI family transcriptional regulator